MGRVGITMMEMAAACRRTADVLTSLRDEELTAPTPCAALSTGELVVHVGGLAQAFTASAHKDFGTLTDTPPFEQPVLDSDWRTAYPAALAALAEAWRRPEAWQGMTRVAGMDLPAPTAGVIALTEVVIHGWDLARSSGRRYDCDPATTAAILPHVSAIAAEGPVEGLFAAAVPIDEAAPAFDRVIALSGRDPYWSPAQPG